MAATSVKKESWAWKELGHLVIFTRERVMIVGLRIYNRASNVHIFSFHMKGKLTDEMDMSRLGRKKQSS